MALFEVNYKKLPSRLLAERFIVPPFTVLDTRQGYWQDRKRNWLSMGIQSELGRGDKLLFHIGHFNYDDEINGIDDTKSSQTSIFDPVLCEITYRWFSQYGDLVLDPFAGGSVRGIVAGSLQRYYTGIDLSENQILANRQQYKDIAGQYDDIVEPDWIVGNSKNVKNLVPKGNEYDLLFTCPPYFNLEVYSDSEEDISNTNDYSEFLRDYSEILSNAYDLLADDSFAVIVVGNVRDKKTGSYYDLAGDTTRIFKECGASFYNDAIILNVAGTLPVRTPKQFNQSRKLGKQHQNYLVYYKGNAKNIQEKFRSFEE